jgi:glutamate synthase domain-containing protein 2
MVNALSNTMRFHMDDLTSKTFKPAQSPRLILVTCILLASGLAQAEEATKVPADCRLIVEGIDQSKTVPQTLSEKTFAAALERTEHLLARPAESPHENPMTELELEQAGAIASREFKNTGGDFKLALLLMKSRMRLGQLQTLKVFARFEETTKRQFARHVYRPILIGGREMMKELGAIWRAYISKSTMDLAALRWSWVEGLFEHGKDESSYGSAAMPGLVTVLSKITSPSPEALTAFQKSTRNVGRDLIFPNGDILPIKPFELSPMISQSGMSYPQLSANAILSLLYIHLSLAKEGIRYVYNTGEGGPSFHMALLDPTTSKEELSSAVARYAIESGMMKPYSLRHAAIEEAVERIVEDRNKLFAEFTPADIAKAQIVGQLGPALNGARTKDDHLDLNMLAKWAEKPFYAGTQFKLKQAAKKGAKVNASKVGAVTAYLRKIMPNKAVEAPELSVEWSNVESLATVIVATKMVTKKPVSLKFAVGQAQEIYDMLEYLRDAGALPDHIQLDGSGYVRQPGSGNAPVMDNTSLNITTATIAVDAILKKLGIRDQIYLEATGDIITPAEAMMNMSLGADGVAAARLWMGMGVGCALVQKCATGQCYYGIASGDGKIFSEGLDPHVVGPKGAKAAQYWFSSYSRLILESGATGDQPFRKQMGLNNPYNTVKIRGDRQLESLKDVFTSQEVVTSLQGRISETEVEALVYGQVSAPVLAPHSSTLPPEQSPEDQALRVVIQETLTP